VNRPRGPNRLPPGNGGQPNDEPIDAEPFVRLAAPAPLDRGSVPSYQERAGELIRRAAIPEGLDPQRLDQVWERLQGGRRIPLHRGAVVLRWAAAAVVLLVAGAVAAGTGVWQWPRTLVRGLISERARPVELSRTAAADSRRRRASAAGALPATPALPPEAPAVAPAAPMDTPKVEPAAPLGAPAPGVATRVAPVASALPSMVPGFGRRADARAAPGPQPPPEPRDAQLAEESHSLGQALVLLRQGRDAAGALAELDRYAARFPNGVLEREALVARVDALLMAKRTAEAQAILSRLSLGSSGRDRELRLIRAELATGSGCAAALQDYQAVWVAHPDGPWGERALWGQAACHARLGDEPRARDDLTLYLRRFPDGPHAADARARLGN